GDFHAQVNPVTLPVNLESPEPNIAEATITLTTKLKWHNCSFQFAVVIWWHALQHPELCEMSRTSGTPKQTQPQTQSPKTRNKTNK
ncbi:MAG TPA: hypothetical protein VHC44_10325, partial [Verrucomicrobiae bacterium]|nr:hypothetical protein [Verrucomicrobiae bacterium]